MIEDYRIYLENLSFLSFSGWWKLQGGPMSLSKNCKVQHDNQVYTKERTIVAAIEKDKGAKISNIKRFHTARKKLDFSILPSFPCGAKKASG